MLALTTLKDPAQIEVIWNALKRDSMQRLLPQGFATNLTELTLWLSAPNTRGFVILQDEEPIGLFLFNSIVPHDSADGHVFTWEPFDTANYSELVTTAKKACAAVMTAFDLHRLNGLLPTDNFRARVFLSNVGWVCEGHIRECLVMQNGTSDPAGRRSDAWLFGMTREDCRKALSAIPLKSDKLDVAAPPEEVAAT